MEQQEEETYKEVIKMAVIKMEKIKNLIQDNLEIPVSQFCTKVKINRTTIVNVLNGTYKSELRLLTIKKICDYFKVNYKEYIED